MHHHYMSPNPRLFIMKSSFLLQLFASIAMHSISPAPIVEAGSLRLLEKPNFHSLFTRAKNCAAFGDVCSSKPCCGPNSGCNNNKCCFQHNKRTCSTNTECCTAGDECIGGICRAPACKVKLGNSCATGCYATGAGTCTNGKCCNSTSGACSRNKDCCNDGGTCTDGVCVPQQCAVTLGNYCAKGCCDEGLCADSKSCNHNGGYCTRKKDCCDPNSKCPGNECMLSCLPHLATCTSTEQCCKKNSGVTCDGGICKRPDTPPQCPAGEIECGINCCPSSWGCASPEEGLCGTEPEPQCSTTETECGTNGCPAPLGCVYAPEGLCGCTGDTVECGVNCCPTSLGCSVPEEGLCGSG